MSDGVDREGNTVDFEKTARLLTDRFFPPKTLSDVFPEYFEKPNE